MNAQPVEIGREPRFFAGDAKVRDQRQAQASADRGALDHTDQRLAIAKQAHGRLVDTARVLRVALVGAREISAGAKHLAFSL
ncbi:hypothetical protein D3C76_1120570 [compost metagenome]